MIKVDLAPKEASKIAKANLLISRMKVAGVVSLAVFVLLVGVVYGLYFYMTRQVTLVGSDVQGVVVTQLQEMSEVELSYRRLVDIVEVAGGLLASRKDFSGVLLDVYDLLPDEVEIEGVRFEEGAVVVNVRANGVQEMSRTVSTLSTVSTQDGTRFDEVALSSVRRGEDGGYLLMVELGLIAAI